MTDKTVELTRRKLLGALGVMGTGAAIGDTGSRALFADEESVEANTLVAGSLDMRVDWEEHYVDWLGSEAEIESVRMVGSAEEVGPDEVGLPDPAHPLIAVAEEDLAAFMDASSIEAFPDANNDGVQDSLAEYDACADFANLPEDLDPLTGLRTATPETVTLDPDTNQFEPLPLVNLSDLKPGDFGELTLSFHLCDNPGYIWLQGGLVTASEGTPSHTEPELADPDEDGPAENEVVELLDAVQTLVWYDEDGDNVYEPGGVDANVDVSLVLDVSNSMDEGDKLPNAKDGAKSLVDTLTADDQASVVHFASEADRDQNLTDDFGQVKTTIDGLSVPGDNTGATNLEGGIVHGAEELLDDESFSPNIQTDPSGNTDTDASNVMVVLSDGEPTVYYDEDGDTAGPGTNSTSTTIQQATDAADAAKNAGIRIFSIAFGPDADDATLKDIASSDSDFFDVQEQDIEAIEQVFANIAQAIASEGCFFRGTLRELLSVVSTGVGIPLDGNRDTAYTEVTGIQNGERTGDPLGLGDPTADGRECFINSTTNALGVAWWLPVDHANEIQTDAVSFDLGFYAEQCRHNTGQGQEAET